MAEGKILKTVTLPSKLNYIWGTNITVKANTETYTGFTIGAKGAWIVFVTNTGNDGATGIYYLVANSYTMGTKTFTRWQGLPQYGTSNYASFRNENGTGRLMVTYPSNNVISVLVIGVY